MQTISIIHCRNMFHLFDSCSIYLDNLLGLNFFVSIFFYKFQQMKILLDSMIFVLLRKTFSVPKGYIIPRFFRFKLKFTRRRPTAKKYCIPKRDDIFFASKSEISQKQIRQIFKRIII